MSNLFGLFEPRKIEVPPSIIDNFEERFPKAINVEWNKSDQYFESVFYDHEQEKIIRYSHLGEFIDLKVNLQLNEIPEKIKKEAEREGEIMNGICIEKPDERLYELIVRDTDLNRFQVVFDARGEVLKNKQL